MDSNLAGIKSFFEPRSITVVGVSTDQSKLSSIIYHNLLRNRKRGTLKASVYPLNPSHARVGELPCYPDFDSLPEAPELVVVAIPASFAAAAVKDSAKAGAKAAVLITGGFAEAGRKVPEQELLAEARRRGVRLLGPNTIGLLDTYSGVDTLFLRTTKKLSSGKEVVSVLRPLRGGVAVITQSGHLGEIVSEELRANRVGLRALVGTGNQLDVSTEDMISYFANDSRCDVIAVYLEGVKDGRRFIQVASAAVKRKPIIVFKMGKTRAGARAALTHTASIVGDYDVYRAAFRAAGVIEAESLQELLDYCLTFSMLKQRPGSRLLISTNAGGAGAVAADEAELDGLDVRPLRKATANLVRHCLAGVTSSSTLPLGNPMDLTATVGTESFVRATGVALAAPYYDMAVVLPTHQTPAVTPDIARLMGDCLLQSGKPASVCVMGKSELASMIQDEFLERGIPSFPTPERAVRSMAALSEYSILRRNPKPLPIRQFKVHSQPFSAIEGYMSWQATDALMDQYKIQRPKFVILPPDSDDAAAVHLKFPLACKLLSPGLAHKTDVGGVILNVTNLDGLNSAVIKLKALASSLKIKFEGVLVQEMVSDGIELLLGATRDVVFGPTVTLGAGGKYAELIRRYAVAIAPLNVGQARQLSTMTMIGKQLGGFRGGPRKTYELARVVSRFSRILCENPQIGQIEINPLIVTARGFSAVDVRVTNETS